MFDDFCPNNCSVGPYNCLPALFYDLLEPVRFQSGERPRLLGQVLVNADFG